MEIAGTFLIAIALAMDSFTVSLSGGASLKTIKLRSAFLVGAYFGFFQFFMSMVGAKGGEALNSLINTFDHWIALGLLLIIGGKMIVESFKKSDTKTFSLQHRKLFLLAIATSIDALGVGLSYALLNKSFLFPSIVIGIVAFAFSAAGLYLGKFLKKILKNKAEFIGGLILIAIGINIAIEHGAFSF